MDWIVLCSWSFSFILPFLRMKWLLHPILYEIVLFCLLTDSRCYYVVVFPKFSPQCFKSHPSYLSLSVKLCDDIWPAIFERLKLCVTRQTMKYKKYCESAHSQSSLCTCRCRAILLWFLLHWSAVRSFTLAWPQWIPLIPQFPYPRLPGTIQYPTHL